MRNSIHLKKTVDYQKRTILNDIESITFEDEVKSEIEQEISEQNLFLALCEMSKDKSPVLDGLTVEFYTTFWPIIKDDFVEVVQTCKKRVLSRMQ